MRTEGDGLVEGEEEGEETMGREGEGLLEGEEEGEEMMGREGEELLEGEEEGGQMLGREGEGLQEGGNEEMGDVHLTREMTKERWFAMIVEEKHARYAYFA